ncbi:MAG: DUF192 domain-containing protein [Bacteroidota bacterium]
MKKLNVKPVIIGVVIICLIAGFFLLKSKMNTNQNQSSILIGKTKILAEVADTENLRIQGLSGRDKLPESTGMLFVFDKPGMYSFWMKDMKFSLDFIWISNNQVVDLTEDVPYPKHPNESLPIYQPKTPVDHVLEVTAGFIKKEGIQIGDAVQF